MAKKTQSRKKNPAAVALGLERAKLGYDTAVKARWANVSAEERREQARKAAEARWSRRGGR